MWQGANRSIVFFIKTILFFKYRCYISQFEFDGEKYFLMQLLIMSVSSDK